MPRRRRAGAGKQVFTASIHWEGAWYVAQALDADVASQGRAEDEALNNLREALELHFKPPGSTALPQLHHVEATLRHIEAEGAAR